ncbi:ABC transporter permease [Candidatus Izemoplasma sp. B36]|uniref:ABC transporter permease n=1 Tax=Candidatus Izemoplasma sp. B36 TaxID=3242468 RepID=UPI0035563A1F
MKNILTIFKKEWDRVIRDKRLVITVLLLPGIMIFLIYTLMGTAMQNMTTEDVYDIAIINPQADFTALYEGIQNADPDSNNTNVIEIQPNQLEAYELLVDNGEYDMLISFSEGIENYDGSGEKPVVYIYGNPNEIASSTINSEFSYYLSLYEQQLSFELHGDRTYFETSYASTEIDEGGIMGTIISSLVPMLVIMFLFSGAMGIGPESIAGEKERGTIATLLVTPVKRSEIAIGKISALSVLTLISAISSFIGISFSLPKLMQFEEGMSVEYGVGQYFMILGVLFSTVFVIVGIISIISAYAKNLKEASSLIMPLYILTILVAITSMFTSGANTNLLMYMIPIYNSVQTLSAILTFDPASLTYLIVTIIANIIYLSIFIFILNRMFNSEKMMFSK